ncbi:acetate kinase [uncultured Massilia sp.]|uniref:acetate kinase n=1 Tax=uncultured Massilia sp. TaxID=169973 RepID=UPI0025DABDBE|nr:acetate kinase [uncultured Massilia sp.]
MRRIPALYSVIGASVALACIPAGAQSGPDLLEQLKIMRQQLEDQRARVDELERQLRASGVSNAAPASAGQLERLRGTGPAPVQASAPATTAAQAAPLDNLRGAGGAPQQGLPAPVTGSSDTPAQQPVVASQGGPVGRAPEPGQGARTPEVAPIFETPGVLTPRNRLVFEPSVQYGYSSSNRVALVGYTVIPALLIGLLDVREVKRNTTTGAATFRYGVSNRFEVEGKIPYVYRSDSTVSREIFTGTAAERAFETSGKGIGDIELGWRYQLNDGGIEKPYYIAGLRFKSRTGRDPFEVVTDCQTRCLGQNVTGTGLPLDLPTGSGFYSLQPSVTWLMPSDPAIFFGTFSYTHNFKRGNVYRTVLNGERELLGEIKPGDVFGFNIGMGLALNERASFSIGYDHSSVGRMKQNGQIIPGSVRLQLGTLLLGGSYRINNKRTLNISVGAGLTRDTPDVTLMLRMPFAF